MARVHYPINAYKLLEFLHLGSTNPLPSLKPLYLSLKLEDAMKLGTAKNAFDHDILTIATFDVNATSRPLDGFLEVESLSIDNLIQIYAQPKVMGIVESAIEKLEEDYGFAVPLFQFYDKATLELIRDALKQENPRFIQISNQPFI